MNVGLPLLSFIYVVYSCCSRDFIGEFTTNLRELTRGPGTNNEYDVSASEGHDVLPAFANRLHMDFEENIEGGGGENILDVLTASIKSEFTNF